MTRTLVLAHGAFGGPWCWKQLIVQLERRGVRCVAVDLNRGSLEADRAALQTQVDRLVAEGCRVSAIGHSLGCASTALLDPKTIASAIFIAGPVRGPGMPDIRGCISPGFSALIKPNGDGLSYIAPDDARDAFYHRCSANDAEAEIARLRPSFLYAVRPAPPPIWEEIPATYVVCNDDRVALNEFQLATAEVLPFSATLDSDHSPMIGQPEALAEIVMSALARAD
jgi:pimeloyl-ACP methyl ester carboxylesterase